MNKKILIVGYGSIGKKHHALIKDMFPEVTIKFFRHNISNKKNSLDSDLYTMDEVKAFNPAISFICNPASNHIEQAIKLGSIGSHFFKRKTNVCKIFCNFSRFCRYPNSCETKFFIS